LAGFRRAGKNACIHYRVYRVAASRQHIFGSVCGIPASLPHNAGFAREHLSYGTLPPARIRLACGMFSPPRRYAGNVIGIAFLNSTKHIP
jgi:hypothetical protein